MNRHSWSVLGFLTLLFLAVPEPVAAYVGPGTGIAVIGAALAVVGSVLLGLFGFVWYPLKRLSRFISQKTRSSSSRTEP